jgi:hypothetical protein
MEAEAGRKRRADVPLTEAQEREASAMLLPTTLPFKLKQAEGRSVRNTKASAAACLLSAPCAVTLTAVVSCPCFPAAAFEDAYTAGGVQQPTCRRANL